MDQRRSFAHIAAINFAMVATLAIGAGLIYRDRMPATTATEYVVSVMAFCAASIVGSLVAWHLRLPRPFGPLVSVVIWVVFFVILLPFLAFVPVPLAQPLGLWIFCAWAAIGSYAYGFLSLNTRLPTRNAG